MHDRVCGCAITRTDRAHDREAIERQLARPVRTPLQAAIRAALARRRRER